MAYAVFPVLLCLETERILINFIVHLSGRKILVWQKGIVFLCSCLLCFFGSAAIQHQCQQTQQDQQLPNHFPPAHIVYLNFSLNSLGVTPSYFLNILLK